MDKDSARSGLLQVECRSLPTDLAGIEFRQEGDGPRSIAWYPALFDQLSEDLGGFRERIGRRAFTKSLQERDVRSLINHDPNLILGRTSKGSLTLAVDLKGLRAESAIPATSYAADLMTNIDNGNISGGSFAFRAEKDSWRLENLEGSEEPVLVRTVNEAWLYDVSLVTFPAYLATEGSASLRSLAAEWRGKLLGSPTETREMPACAMMKAMCATCEMDCSMKAELMKDAGERQAQIYDMSRYRHRLELLKLKS